MHHLCLPVHHLPATPRAHPPGIDICTQETDDEAEIKRCYRRLALKWYAFALYAVRAVFLPSQLANCAVPVSVQALLGRIRRLVCFKYD